jgi:hypothetical protein
MTRIFAADLALWCSIATMVASLSATALGSLIWLELIRSDKSVSGYEVGHGYNPEELRRMHKLAFPMSKKRLLLYISFGIMLGSGIVDTAMYANDLMDNNLLHLISRTK